MQQTYVYNIRYSEDFINETLERMDAAVIGDYRITVIEYSYIRNGCRIAENTSKLFRMKQCNVCVLRNLRKDKRKALKYECGEKQKD